MNQQELSLEYWNKILEQDPKNKVILTRAGDAYRSTGDFDGAVEYYQRALNIEFDTYAVMGLAVVSKAQKKFDEASESLRRLIQQDPRNYRLYIELSDCRMKKGEKREAVEILEEFQRQGIKNNTVNDLLEKIKN
jgi:tetratricopeptide (TPR) repeat protein